MHSITKLAAFGSALRTVVIWETACEPASVPAAGLLVCTERMEVLLLQSEYHGQLLKAVAAPSAPGSGRESQPSAHEWGSRVSAVSQKDDGTSDTAGRTTSAAGIEQGWERPVEPRPASLQRRGWILHGGPRHMRVRLLLPLLHQPCTLVMRGPALPAI